MNTHRALAVGALLIAALAPPARAASSSVEETANAFSPRRVEIALNDKVVWTNGSSATHTVTFEDGTDLHSGCEPGAILQVGCQGPGATAERIFRTAGSYPYYCKFHRDAGMSGVVVVLGAATSTTSPASSTTTTKASTTTTTAKPTSSTTTTTRPLATSSTQSPSSTTTTTSETTSVLLPGDPPPLTDETSTAANESGRGEDETDSATVALIVALLLGVSGGGGLLLWRLRPGRP